MRVRVQNRAGELLFWAKESQARRLLSDGRVRLLATRRRVHALEVLDALDAEPSSSPVTRTRYSHNREVPEVVVDADGVERRVHPLNANPRGVWTLKHIPNQCREIFGAVVNSCAV